MQMKICVQKNTDIQIQPLLLQLSSQPVQVLLSVLLIKRDALVLMLPLDCSAIYAPAVNSEIH